MIELTTKIYQIDDLCEINKYIDTKVQSSVYALFDFDDTWVMTGHKSACHLGGLKWRDALRKTITELKKSKELDEDTQIFEFLTLFIAKSAPVTTVQPETASFIDKLKAKVTMVFTARGQNGKNAWYKLNIGGINALTEKQMNNAGIFLPPQSELPCHDKIYNNMIFAQNAPKDEVLTDIFEKKILIPSQISVLVFVDDKEDAIPKIQKVAEAYGIPFLGFHFTAVAKQEKGEYSLLKSTIQLINLFAVGKFLEMDALQTEAAKISVSPEAYFKESLIRINQFFMDHKLYKPYADHDHFFETIKKEKF